MKKIKLNGEWIELKDEDIQDVEVASETTDEEGDAAVTEKARKIAKAMAKEIVSELNVDEVSALKKQVNTFMDRMNPMDSKLRKILNGKDLYSQRDELTKEEKIVGFFHGLVTRNDSVIKALAEGVDADGGYLFPNEFLAELVRDLPEINVMRQYVRIIPMRRDVMDITSLVSKPVITWTAENATKSTTSAHFGRLTLTARKMAAILYSSDELIDDSDIFDVVSMIISLFAETIADEEERVIWNGNGTTQPQGINTARGVGTISSFSAGGAGTFDHVIQLYYSLPAKYRNNAAFFMSDAVAEEVSKLKDTTNQYLWQPSVQEGQPDRIRGKAVVISNQVPDGQIYFGDLRLGYFLGDRQRMTVKTTQDSETAFTKDQTGIRVVSRIGGLVVNGAAVRAVTSF